MTPFSRLAALGLGLPVLLVPAWMHPGVPAGSPTPAPAWFVEHLAETMAHGGRTIADNAAYVGPNEPFDAYGLEWSWGVGRQSIRGRLFGLRGGEEVADFWELRTVWHPGAKEARAYQFGSDGTFASGTLRPLDGGGMEVEQIFVAPDGSTTELRHESFSLKNGGNEGSSFKRVDGEWREDRTYTWLPAGPSKDEAAKDEAAQDEAAQDEAD